MVLKFITQHLAVFFRLICLVKLPIHISSSLDHHHRHVAKKNMKPSDLFEAGFVLETHLSIEINHTYSRYR